MRHPLKHFTHLMINNIYLTRIFLFYFTEKIFSNEQKKEIKEFLKFSFGSYSLSLISKNN